MRVCDRQFLSDVEECYVMIAGKQVSIGDYLLINNSIRGIYIQSHQHTTAAGKVIYLYYFDVSGKGITRMLSNEIKSVVKEQKSKSVCMGSELRNWTAPW